MADKSNSTKPWSSVCKLNDTPRGAMTFPRHYQKTKEWVVPQLLEWSSHSLANEITQFTKTNHTIHGRHIHPLRWHTVCGLCFSLNLNKSTSYLSLCLSLNFCNETSRTWASLGPKARCHGFGRAQIPVRYDWVIKHSTESLQWEFESQSWINSFKCNFQKWKDDDLPNTL